jgi:two-component system, cell cycle sensor histidine kinase and response regulator CckA
VKRIAPLEIEVRGNTVTQTPIPTNAEAELQNVASPRSPADEALAASELRYRRLFEAAKDGILILDAETGVVMDVNPFLVELLGFSHTQFLGKAIWNLGFFRDIVANQENFAELQQKEYLRYDDLALKTKDGRRIEVEFVSNVYLANHHKVIQCNIRDVSERKRVEAALSAEGVRRRILFEQSRDGIVVLDAGGKVIEANRRYAEMLGYSMEEVLRLHVWDWDTRWSRDQLVEMLGSVDDAGEHLETRHRRKDGTVYDVEVSSTGAVCSGQKMVFCVCRDITERRRVESSNARLAMAVEQAAETIVITDVDGTILYANPAFTRITGYTCEEAVGQNPRILKSDKQDEEFYRGMWSTLTAGKVWSGHLINKRKDGSLYEEDATISPVRNAAGTVINYVAVKRDVTHEAMLERQLHQAQKMEAVGRLAGGVAHDFNNLLMGIMGYTDLCRGRIEPDHPIQEWLGEIMRDAQRSADITRQLLAFARKQTIEPKVLDLNEAVAGMLTLLRRLIGEDINLAWLPGANLRPVRLDPSQVDQVLANLCLNARDAIAGVGKVTVETTNATVDAGFCSTHTEALPGAYVCLAVSDDGCGMDKKTLAQIFEPFFTTKGLGKGTGLGLATVYGIVKQNGGFIRVYSEPDLGTTFRLYLPYAAGDAEESASVRKAEVPGGKGETILLVEDEKSLRVICSVFLDALGYKVLLAETPEDALKLAEQHPGDIHLLLTDVIMPGMNGRQLAQRIVAVKPGVKVLFMSGYTADVIAERGVLDQNTAFIAKPFMCDDLARKMREVLET